jgi:hypothetical protein
MLASRCACPSGHLRWAFSGLPRPSIVSSGMMGPRCARGFTAATEHRPPVEGALSRRGVAGARLVDDVSGLRPLDFDSPREGAWRCARGGRAPRDRDRAALRAGRMGADGLQLVESYGSERASPSSWISRGAVAPGGGGRVFLEGRPPCRPGGDGAALRAGRMGADGASPSSWVSRGADAPGGWKNKTPVPRGGTGV